MSSVKYFQILKQSIKVVESESGNRWRTRSKTLLKSLFTGPYNQLHYEHSPSSYSSSSHIASTYLQDNLDGSPYHMNHSFDFHKEDYFKDIQGLKDLLAKADVPELEEENQVMKVNTLIVGVIQGGELGEKDTKQTLPPFLIRIVTQNMASIVEMEGDKRLVSQGGGRMEVFQDTDPDLAMAKIDAMRGLLQNSSSSLFFCLLGSDYSFDVHGLSKWETVCKIDKPIKDGIILRQTKSERLELVKRGKGKATEETLNTSKKNNLIP